MKKILFVTYGGGHARMVAPVAQALKSEGACQILILALTQAGQIMQTEGLEYFSYKDIITAEDTLAQIWGGELAALYHGPESGMPEAETIAYLGLNYAEMIERFGEVEAAQRWQNKGRHAFLPVSLFIRLLTKLQPDLVVTTNAPRSEQAAVMAAKALGIPTLSMVDLFGLRPSCKLEADYVTVLSPRVIAHLQREQGVNPGQRYFVTGNPAFDLAFDCRGPADPAWRQAHLPALPENAKALLWIDDPGYMDVTGALQTRMPRDITADLQLLAEAAQAAGAYLLIRPHPSQAQDLYRQWIAQSDSPRLLLVADYPLYPILKTSDVVITYESTVACQALLMRRPVIQLKHPSGTSALPLADWGVAAWAEPATLPETVKRALAQGWDAGMQARTAELLPQTKAAPVIADYIKHILFSE